MNGDNTFEKAINKALSLLSYGAKSERRLFEKLTEAGFDENTAREAVELMKSYGYVDDEKLAADYIRACVESKGHGKLKIMDGLRLKGVSAETAKTALDEFYAIAEENAELENAVKTLRKRLKGNLPADNREKQSAYGFLLRRGFTGETAAKALKEMGQDINEYED